MTSIQPGNPSIQPIDFDECLKDSPKFRHSLKENLSYIDKLEACMEKTVKQCHQSIESGKSYLKTQSSLVTSLTDLSDCFKDDRDVSIRLETLLAAFKEIIRLHTIIVDQAARTIGSGMTKFIQDDLSKIKETRKSFEKMSHDHDQVLVRYSQPLKKQGDDSENLLIATSTAFLHTSLDLSIQLTTLQTKKGYEVLDSVLSFTKAYGTYFHQGSDLFDDLKPYIGATNDLLVKRRDECESLVRILPGKHLMVSNKDIQPHTFKDHSNGDRVHLEGYLFKRASNAFKVWNRRWFILEDHQLLYQKRGDIHPTIMEEDLRLCIVKLVDRPDIERRFCFEVLSPQKNHILQADSEEACQMWISTIQAGIDAAYHDVNHYFFNCSMTTNNQSNLNHDNPTLRVLQCVSHRTPKIESLELARQDHSPSSGSELSSTLTNDNLRNHNEPHHNLDNCTSSNRFLASSQGDNIGNAGIIINNKMSVVAPSANGTTTCTADAPLKPQRAYSRILALPGNDQCCDCGSAEPKWASINLGITLCIECSGIHRSLGVHVSKVRSLTLDTDVWSPETVQLMLSLGNVRINSIYLERYRKSNDKETELIDHACSTSSRQEREIWIKDKYVDKKYIGLNNRKEDGMELKDDDIKGTDNRQHNDSSGDEAIHDYEDTTMTNSSTGDAHDETYLTANESQLSIVQDAKDAEEKETNEIIEVHRSRKCKSDDYTDSIKSNHTKQIDAINESTNQSIRFYESVESGDLISMAECMAFGAQIDWRNKSNLNRTALHHAASNSSSRVIIEYLLINGWQVNIQDDEGSTPLHLATSTGNTSHVCQFLKRGADQSLKDNKGQDAVSIAVDRANADIVTLLRLAKLNDEMKRDEFGCNPEDTIDYYIDFADYNTNSKTTDAILNISRKVNQNSYISVSTHTDDETDDDQH